MRQLLACCIIFFSCLINASAQYDTIAGPPGYTITQLRSANEMIFDGSENLWMSFFKIGLGKYDGTGWTMFDSLNSGLLRNKINTVAANASGIWAGTDTGLFLFHEPVWTHFSTANSGLQSDTVLKLYSTGGNDLYIYGLIGFSHYNGNVFQHYNTSNSGIVNDTIQCMFKDVSGILWIGTRNGLSKWDGTTWQNFTTSNSSLPDNNIQSLIMDGNQHLCVGTETKGLYFLSANEFICFRDFADNYFSHPQKVKKIFARADGSILYSLLNDFYYYTDPSRVTVHGQFLYASDTLSPSVMDSHGRIWKLNKNPPVTIYISDSNYASPEIFSPSSYSSLDINQVRCGMYNDNTFHWDNIGETRYEVPKNNFTNSIFASAIWLGGLDPEEDLHLSAQTYKSIGLDFWPGPLDTVNATLDSATAVQFDSIWKINMHTIDEFITQFNLGNVTNGSYQIPGIIQSWPTQGTGNISKNLAPFVDVNTDGHYNPIDGDHPEIKGDQMLWWVFNDNGGIHTESGGIAMGLEIHAKAYAYSCLNIPDSNEAVNYTTFYSFDVINRSDTDYHDVYLGLWVDGDLGNYLDDYVGCNIENDFGYFYNGENNDEGISGYGLNPPMQSVVVLKGPLAEPNDTIDNNHNGITDEPDEHCMMNHFTYFYGTNEPCLGYPYYTDDYYQYLQTHNTCGTHFTYGGNGHGGGIGATNIPTDYFYPGTPYDTGWTDASAGNLPSDRRFLMSSGPFSLRKGETRTVDYAYIFTRDESAPNGLNTSIAKNIADVKRVKRWFDTDSFPCNNSSIGIEELNGNIIDFSVYPNPASDYATVHLNSVSGKTTLELFSAIGEKLSDYIFPGGRKEFSIKTGNLSKGIYFLRLSGESGSVTKKLVVR